MQSTDGATHGPVDVLQAQAGVVRQQAAVHEQVAADLEHHRVPSEEPARAPAAEQDVPCSGLAIALIRHTARST